MRAETMILSQISKSAREEGIEVFLFAFAKSMLTSATLQGGIDIKNCSMNRSSRAHLVDHCIIFTRNQGIAITVLNQFVNTILTFMGN